MTAPSEKTGIVLLAMGGPETTADIPSYLFNIFSDRNIIRLPGGRLIQKPFARMISRRRAPQVSQNYERIGGGSPLYKWTRSQADHVERLLATDGDFRCYIGMRYFRPLIRTAVEQAVTDGCTQLVFLPMYPQYSRATTGSSFIEAQDALKKYPNVRATFVDDFHRHSDYISLLRAYIDRNMRKDELLLFSAHSLPQKFVDEGDPYVDQVRETARLAANGRDYVVTFQSRTGPVNWVGPDTVKESERLLESPDTRLFIVPIAFVCDHIETLFELDIELPEILGVDKGKRIRRMPMFNDDPQFAELLTTLVREKVNSRVEA